MLRHLVWRKERRHGLAKFFRCVTCLHLLGAEWTTTSTNKLWMRDPQTYWMEDEWTLWHYFPAHFPFPILHMHVFQVTSNKKLQCMRYWVWLKRPTFWVIYWMKAKSLQEEIIFQKSFIQTTQQSHESQATLIGHGRPNTVKKKRKINSSAMHAIVNKHVYISSQDLHISMREILTLLLMKNTLLAYIWQYLAKMWCFFFCHELIISM